VREVKCDVEWRKTKRDVGEKEEDFEWRR